MKFIYIKIPFFSEWDELEEVIEARRQMNRQMAKMSPL